MLKLNPKTRSAGPSIGRPRVGEPYTPRTLEEFKIANTFPSVDNDFPPEGNWEHLYRIWGGQGWIDHSYRNIGTLKIERISKEQENRFTLRIKQKVVHLGGIVHTITAVAECHLDTIASLIEWNLTSTMTDTSGNSVPELNLEYMGCMKKGSIERTVNGITSTVNTDVPVTSDWTMFEAIQRMPFSEPHTPAFNSMDGLTVLKKNHRLHYREHHSENMKNQNYALQNFYQLGYGVLPYDWWLDEHHRLLMMISTNRIYFLDENAEKAFEDNVTSLRKGGRYSG